MSELPLISAELLEILRCPETGQRVQLAPEELVERLRRLQQQSRLLDVQGRTVEGQLDGALVREDGQVAYLILDRIPRMLADEAVRLDQLETPGS